MQFLDCGAECEAKLCDGCLSFTNGVVEEYENIENVEVRFKNTGFTERQTSALRGRMWGRGIAEDGCFVTGDW